jgi:hypothetical protein
LVKSCARLDLPTPIGPSITIYLASTEPIHLVRVFQLIPQLGNRLLQFGVPGIRGNLGEGDEHEPSFMHAGVWDLKDGGVEDLVTIHENVQVDGARSGGGPGVWAAQSGLDLLTAGQQILEL